MGTLTLSRMLFYVDIKAHISGLFSFLAMFVYSNSLIEKIN